MYNIYNICMYAIFDIDIYIYIYVLCIYNDIRACNRAFDGPDSTTFGLEPNFGCCTANFDQGSFSYGLLFSTYPLTSTSPL